MPPDLAQFGFLVVAIKPDLLMPLETYKARVSEYREAIRTTRPIVGGPLVRMPFDRSAAERRRRLSEDAIDVDDSIYAQLTAIAG
jgi:LDH2 family malate/lactate/ureidoglycolate dehydrogenase